MKALEERILRDGLTVGTEIVKVDSFLNHQIDTDFLLQLGDEFARIFAGTAPTKILTMESSGISVAMATALSFGRLPVIFAKKTAPSTMVEETYAADVMSFTRGKVSTARVAKKFLAAADRVLIIDDFLAHGEAASGLVEIVRQAGADLVGVGIVIEKAFQGGREKLAPFDCPIAALARIGQIENGQIHFLPAD
ncbi:MAG: xanthine phosphoribosyltransferase [Bacillota bacterium]|nr:xanthine phosphoribosyltransferase [Bacillota bacterium]